MYHLNFNGKHFDIGNKFSLALANQWVERFEHDPSYCEEKIERTSHMSEFVAVLEYFNLDHKGQRSFAEHLKITLDELEVCAHAIRKVIN